MIYIDKLGLCLNKNVPDIHFTNIFIDKIINYFFTNKNDNFVFIEVGSLHGRDTVDIKNSYKNSICHCIEGLKPNFDKSREVNSLTTIVLCLFSEWFKQLYSFSFLIL